MTAHATQQGALGARIKQLRTQAGMSKAALARRVGVSDVSVCYWESGAIEQIGHLRLLALGEALGCTVSELLEDPRLPALEAKCREEAYLAGMEHGHHWTVEGGYVPGDEEAAAEYVAERQAEGEAS